MFDFVLPLLYVFLFGNIILRTRFFKNGPGTKFLLSIFITKCLLSVIYWELHVSEYGGGDSFFYFLDGEIIGNKMAGEQWKYLQLTFGPNGGEIPSNIAPEIELMGYWTDTSDYMVVRFNAFVYPFSFGNPYVHGIFMSFLSLSGLLALYKGVSQFSLHNKQLLKVAIFGIPSVLFWTSGLHKEGLLIFALGWFFYAIFSMGSGKLNWKYINLAIVSSLFVYLIRDFVFFLLLPGLVAYLLSKRFPKYTLPINLAVYLSTAIIGAQLYILPGGINYLQLIAQKQAAFKALTGGNTTIELHDFEPNLLHMAVYAPEAFFNVIIKPVAVGFTPISHFLIVIENLFFLLMIVTALLFLDYKRFKVHPAMIWFKLYGLSLVILTGFIVPNIGAIVRYRSIALPFLLVPLFFHCKSDLLLFFKKIAIR
ncbi:MAG: hypothetical protein SFW35_01115 [Chitinophagales bacterium]|nr:hypothetical protein [Chitinophagales bacterium]